MQLSKKEEAYFIRKLLESRLRILCKQGFYGSLLMHMEFALDESVRNVACDRRKIYFNPLFLDQISDKELDFVLIHEIVHLSLKHSSRRKGARYKEVYDEAADIVVNSNILKSFNMDDSIISMEGETQPHQAPDNKEGYEFSVEELYNLLMLDRDLDSSSGSGNEGGEDGPESIGDNHPGFDDHTKWDSDSDYGINDLDWEKYVLDACETMSIRDPSNSRGLIPAFAARLYERLKNPETDWRMLLNNFVQEDTNDYSFMPPDRRFSDSPFFLPDLNDPDEVIKDVLFMIDTSGSMSDSQITLVFSEVKGAIDQFGGKLQGWLGYFDAAIIEPKPFDSVEELLKIRPYGGGGTNFQIIFSYVRNQMKDKNVSSIVILTDGYAPWPKEEEAMGIPTIWIVNNRKTTPPWGKVARITDEDANKDAFS